MTGDDLLKKFKNPVKCGELKYVNLDCLDLNQMTRKKACRAFNRLSRSFRIDYTPSLKGHDALFVPEDVTPGNSALVKRAFEDGVTTVVVQHGAAAQMQGFTPLSADYFLCWPESRAKFMSWGMPPEKLLPFMPQVPKNLKKINGMEAVLFLAPPAKGRQVTDCTCPTLYSEFELLRIVWELMSKEKNLKIKPHPKYFNHIEKLIDPKIVILENAYDLIYSAERIYSFEGCTTVKDCEVLGKKAIIIVDQNKNCFLEDRKHMYVVGE